MGRGTDFPFEVYGSLFLKGVSGYSFYFTPESMSGATEPPFEGEACYGRDLRRKPVTEIWSEGINLEYLIQAYHEIGETTPDVSFFGTPVRDGVYWFDLLIGTDEIRKRIESGESAEEIEASWQEEVDAFKKQRSQYLLYEE